MPGFVTSVPEVLLLMFVCAAYAVFLWMNFRAGRYVMLWSSAGIVVIQIGSALGSSNVPAAIAAAGFHAAMVAAIYTATKKNAGVLIRRSIPTKDI